jgi:hypothetical protein
VKSENTAIARQPRVETRSRSNDLTNVFMTTEESTLLLGVLSPVGMKPAEAEIQDPDIENSGRLAVRDQFKNNKKCSEKFVTQKECNM